MSLVAMFSFCLLRRMNLTTLSANKKGGHKRATLLHTSFEVVSTLFSLSSRVLLSLAAVAKNRQLHCATTKAHCLSAGRRPDIDATPFN